MKNKKNINIVALCMAILIQSCSNTCETKTCDIKSDIKTIKCESDYKKIDSLAQFHYKQFFTNSLKYNEGKDLSNELYKHLDSTLKYLNVLMSYDSTDYDIHLRIISVYELKEVYEPMFDYIELLPQYEWLPYYKECLKFKCKALNAKQNGDIASYNMFLDSIIDLWTPDFKEIESLCDSILAYPYMEYAFDENYSPKLLLYEKYYEIFRFRNGENCMKQILEEKKEMHKWDEESYEIIYVSIFGHDNLKMVI